MVSVHSRFPRRVFAPLLAAAVALLAGALVACGSDDDGDGGGSASADAGSTNEAVVKAEQDVAEAQKPITELGFDATCAGPLPEAKEIAIIRNVPAPLPTAAAEAVKVAAEAAGWEGTIIDGEGNPQGWQDGVNRAITSGADAIVTVALPTQLIQPAIDRANDEGIPVMGALADLDVRTETEPPPGLINYATANGFQMGYLLGQWVLKTSPDGAQAIRLTSAEITNLQRYSDGFAAALEEGGSSFEIVAEAQSPISDLQGSKGPQRIAALLRSNPDAEYIMTMSETWFPLYEQAVQLLGRDDVTALGADGDFTIPKIQEGAKLVISAPDTMLYGWYSIDALVRFFNDLDQPSYDLDIQLVDSSNAGEVDGEGITAEIDLQSEFTQLWTCES